MVKTGVTLEEIQKTAKRLTPYIRQTPVFHATHPISPLASDTSLYLKLEQHQLTGSFKVRGATNKTLQISTKTKNQGLVAASGGNHGRAVAYVGKQQCLQTTIYLPTTTPKEKILAIQAFGAQTIIAGDNLDEATSIAFDAAQSDGRGFIHPFDDPAVVNGQGTIGLEILETVKNLDAILVAIGGGGLISGIATAVKTLNPTIKVYGIEPEGCPSMKLALEHGHIIQVDKITTKVGTLAIGKTCQRNFEIVGNLVDDIVLVSDEEMLAAAKWLWSNYGVAAELSGAASVAALTSGKLSLSPKTKVCAVICGLGSEGIMADSHIPSLI
jgi:threonine dehydratase